VYIHVPIIGYVEKTLVSGIRIRFMKRDVFGKSAVGKQNAVLCLLKTRIGKLRGTAFVGEQLCEHAF
jgi:hypothetical protein